MKNYLLDGNEVDMEDSMRNLHNGFQHAVLARCSVMVSVLAISAAVFLFSFTNRADAQSRYCQQLSSQLAYLKSANVGRGTSKQYREYDDAVRKQQVQISRTRSIAKRGGCLRRGLFRNRSSQCRRIVDGLERMLDNLDELKEIRADFSPAQTGNSHKIEAIIREMQVGGCDQNGVIDTRTATVAPPRKPRRRSLLEQIFGVRTYGNDGRRGIDEYGGNEELSGRYGTFRTLCVRKSDGYYFPISFSTVPSRFDIDEQTCHAMCPGGEVALYHHLMPGEDSEEMISYRTETPYSQEPFAFAYRKEHKSENTCRFSTAGIEQTVDAFQDGTTEEQPETVRIGIPVFRIDPSISPDTYDNLVSGLTIGKAKKYLIAARAPVSATTLQLASDRKVRIVGPAFFPIQ